MIIWYRFRVHLVLYLWRLGSFPFIWISSRLGPYKFSHLEKYVKRYLLALKTPDRLEYPPFLVIFVR